VKENDSEGNENRNGDRNRQGGLSGWFDSSAS